MKKAFIFSFLLTFVFISCTFEEKCTETGYISCTFSPTKDCNGCTLIAYAYEGKKLLKTETRVIDKYFSEHRVTVNPPIEFKNIPVGKIIDVVVELKNNDGKIKYEGKTTIKIHKGKNVPVIFLEECIKNEG